MVAYNGRRGLTWRKQTRPSSFLRGESPTWVVDVRDTFAKLLLKFEQAGKAYGVPGSKSTLNIETMVWPFPRPPGQSAVDMTKLGRLGSSDSG